MYHMWTPPIPKHAITHCWVWLQLKRRTLDLEDDFLVANTRESWISSAVNRVGLLTTDKKWSFKTVDCSWYRIGAGKDFHRPIFIMLGTDTLAARAIVGADIRIECVLKDLLSKPKWSAASLTASCMSLYIKHVNLSCTLNDKKGSSSNLKECFDHWYTKWTNGTGWWLMSWV